MKHTQSSEIMKKIIEICRFCLENDENMYDMFADNSKDLYLQKIAQITDSAEPEEFSIACFNCLRLLEISWKFRMQAQSSHDFLRKVIRSVPNSKVDHSAPVAHNHDIDNDLMTTPLEENESQSLLVTDCQPIHPEKRNKTDTNWSIEIEPLNSGLMSIVPNNNRVSAYVNEERAPANDLDGIDNTNNSPVPNDQTSLEMIDESTNDEALDYFEQQPQYSDREIKDESVTIKSKNNIFACNICNRSFTQAGNLYTHKLTHSGIRDHSCNICQKKFKFSSHLKNHQFTHQERRFSCPICKAKFHKHSYLKTHQRQHSGEKPYSCECGKKFNNLSNYKSHQRIHTEEKKYACDNCGKRFTQSSSCLRHMKKACNKNLLDS